MRLVALGMLIAGIARADGAAIANQELLGDVSNGPGARAPGIATCGASIPRSRRRFDRHLQARLQSSFARQTSDLLQGEQLVAAQLTLCF